MQVRSGSTNGTENRRGFLAWYAAQQQNHSAAPHRVSVTIPSLILTDYTLARNGWRRRLLLLHPPLLAPAELPPAAAAALADARVAVAA